MTTPNFTEKQLDALERFRFDRHPRSSELPAHALDLDAIEARAKASSAARWEYGPAGVRTIGERQKWLADTCREGDGDLWAVWFRDERGVVVPAVTGDGPNSERNAEFIANAHDDVPALVAEVRRLREVVAHLRSGGSIAPDQERSA